MTFGSSLSLFHSVEHENVLTCQSSPPSPVFSLPTACRSDDKNITCRARTSAMRDLHRHDLPLLPSAYHERVDTPLVYKSPIQPPEFART